MKGILVMKKFGNNKVRIAPHVTSVLSLFPAILFYIEDEGFEDATVFMLSLKLFALECVIGIRLKKKSNIL